MFAGLAAWCGPLIIKYWGSGVAALFDFQYKTYEIDQYGNKRDVSTIDSILVGPFMKFVGALFVGLAATVIVPMEMIVRLLNHIRFERKLGIKGTIAQAPRLQALLSVGVAIVIIIAGIIGNIVATIKENTSDISDAEIVELLENLEGKTNNPYKICKFNNGFLTEYATITETDDSVTFVVVQPINCTVQSEELGNKGDYQLNPGTYIYTNGTWTGADEIAKFILSYYTLGHALDFDAIKGDTSKIVVNEGNGLGYWYDKESHDYYEIKPKNNSDIQFDYIMVEKNLAFVTCPGGYNYVYIFN
jgi:hypothetical protein